MCPHDRLCEFPKLTAVTLAPQMLLGWHDCQTVTESTLESSHLASPGQISGLLPKNLVEIRLQAWTEGEILEWSIESIARSSDLQHLNLSKLSLFQPSTGFLPLNTPLMQDILSVLSALRLICDYIRNVRRLELRYGTTNSTVKGERLLRLVSWKNYHIYGMTRSSNIGILCCRHFRKKSIICDISSINR
jgi:hypothetical protein